MKRTKTNAERAAAHRAKGRAIACTLLDANAEHALELLTKRFGSQRSAIEYALVYTLSEDKRLRLG